MKRIALLIAVTLTMSGVMAQDSNKIAPRNVTFDSVYHDVTGAISALATGLKTTGDHVYGVLVYQQRVDAVKWLVVIILWLFPLSKFFKSLNKEWSDGDNLVKNGVVGLVCLIVSAVTFSFIISNISTITTGLFNPEYGALQDILDAIKPQQ